MQGDFYHTWPVAVAFQLLPALEEPGLGALSARCSSSPSATAGRFGSVSALESIDPMGRGLSHGGTDITQVCCRVGQGDLQWVCRCSACPHTLKEEEPGSDEAQGGLHRAPVVCFEVALPLWLPQGKDHPQKFTATHLPPPASGVMGACATCSVSGPWFQCLDPPWSFKAWIRSKERFSPVQSRQENPACILMWWDWTERR